MFADPEARGQGWRGARGARAHIGLGTSAPPPSVFQALGTITAVPVTGPQVSSLQRLAGQGAAVLPQVSSRRAGPGPCVRPSVRPSLHSATPAPQHRRCRWALSWRDPHALGATQGPPASSALGQVSWPLACRTKCPGLAPFPSGFSLPRAPLTCGGARPRTPLSTPACAHAHGRARRRELSSPSPGASAVPQLLPGFRPYVLSSLSPSQQTCH